MADGIQERVIYLDSNPIIYLVEGEPASDPLKPLFEALRNKPQTAVTSELTLAEVLAPARRKQALPLHMKRRMFLQLLVWSRFIALALVSRQVLYETADLRRIQPMRLPDALHMVTAIHSQCRFFLTRDRKIRTPMGMIKVSPDAAGVSQVLEALN
ncbi:MAG TPA: PIN domain-containing protein [Afifellaceae bacterium]|nr:PIN domain-containing protein [Afifellaceae bacterium]